MVPLVTSVSDINAQADSSSSRPSHAAGSPGSRARRRSTSSRWRCAPQSSPRAGGRRARAALRPGVAQAVDRDAADAAVVPELAGHPGEVAQFERGAPAGAEDVAGGRPGLPGAVAVQLLAAAVVGEGAEAARRQGDMWASRGGRPALAPDPLVLL